MTTNKEMKELNPEMMEQISGGFRHFNPLFPGLPHDFIVVPDKPKDETKDEPKGGGATGGW